MNEKWFSRGINLLIISLMIGSVLHSFNAYYSDNCKHISSVFFAFLYLIVAIYYARLTIVEWNRFANEK